MRGARRRPSTSILCVVTVVSGAIVDMVWSTAGARGVFSSAHEWNGVAWLLRNAPLNVATDSLRTVGAMPPGRARFPYTGITALLLSERTPRRRVNSFVSRSL